MAKDRTTLFALDRGISGGLRHGPKHQRPGLRMLDAETHPRAYSGRLVQAQSYDDGTPIAVRTASGAFPMYPQQLAVASTPAFSDSFDLDDDSYYVEPFEEPAPAEPPKAAVVAPPVLQPSPDPARSAMQPATAAPHPPAPHCPPASTAAPAVTPHAGTSPDSEQDNFEDDIRQILEKAAQQPQQPAKPEPILKKPDLAEQQPEPPPTEPAQQASTGHPHDIFEAMNGQLSNATTFDLGRVDLNRRFNEIESALDAEELAGEQKAVANSFTDAATLDDADLMNDLSAVSSLLEEKLREEQAAAPQPEPPPLAEPAPQPSATPATPPPATEPEQPASAAPEAPPAVAPKMPPADAPAPQAPSSAKPEVPTNTIDITYKVLTAAATEGVSQQAAGAAMLVAWRDQSTIDMQALLAGSGDWASYAPGLKSVGPEFFKIWGLKELKPETLTIERLRDTMRAHGPLWLQNPAVESTIRIITAMNGDGTTEGTTITFVDPAADAQSASQTTNINVLKGQLADGPVRIAHLTG